MPKELENFLKNNEKLFLKADDSVYLRLLKDLALRQYELGILNQSEHCSIEAYLDYNIYSLETKENK